MKGLPIWPVLLVCWLTAISGCESQVLIAGGQDQNGDVLQTAEIFDSETRAFHPTASMSQGHFLFTATRLLNGLVLAAGCGALPTAELFNAGSGTFSPTGNMNSNRSAFTATLFPDGVLAGEVLIVGGTDPTEMPPDETAELFNPATNTFALTGASVHVRVASTATLLPSGSVLIAGGFDETDNPTNSAELYNPLTGTFAATGSMTTERKAHTVILLTTGPFSGQVLIAGGTDATFLPLTSTELYDPVTGVFTAMASMSVPRQLHTATMLENGQVLIAGGFTYNFETDFGTGTDTAELYDPLTGVFSLTGTMVSPRYQHTATLLTEGPLAGEVLLAGGESFLEPIASAELYNPNTNSFTATGSMSSSRAGHVAAEIFGLMPTPAPTPAPRPTPFPTPMPGM